MLPNFAYLSKREFGLVSHISFVRLRWLKGLRQVSVHAAIFSSFHLELFLTVTSMSLGKEYLHEWMEEEEGMAVGGLRVRSPF